MPPLKSYGSDLSYSYAPGVFPALELMKNAPRRPPPAAERARPG